MDTIETPGAAEAPGGRIGSGGQAKHGLIPGGDPERHPTIDNVNALLAGTLNPNRAHLSANSRHDRCAGGAGGCDRPAICLDRHRPRDYPFVFLLTCSNVIQLILIFVIAVAQRQLSLHDELRAEADHGAISRLLYHQGAQELLLVRLAEKLDVDARDLRPILSTLAGKAARPPA